MEIEYVPVVAGNKKQFDDFFRDNKEVSPIYFYIKDVNSIRGLHYHRYMTIGTFFERADISELLQELESHKRNCQHGSSTLTKIISGVDTCLKCNKSLAAHEIEILNQYYEIGGFCDNEECERYLILIV